MNANLFTRRLLPGLLIALSTCSYAGVLHIPSLHPALGQTQANSDTKPKPHKPIVVRAPSAIPVVPPPPIQPPPDEALQKRHAPITVLTDPEGESQAGTTIHIPVKPPHGEDNPAALQQKQDTTAPRTDPCPPHVVCADSGASMQVNGTDRKPPMGAKDLPGTPTKALTQPLPALPANQPPILRQEGLTETIGDRSATPRVAAPWSQSDKKKFYDTADMVRAKFATSDVEGKAIFDAVRSGNKALVHTVLIRNGFTEQQLDGAGYLLQDNTGGRAFQGGIKVQLAPECCPLVLIVGIKY